MKKIYKKLTSEQIKKGVVFSSCLSKYTTEQKDDIRLEVFKTDKDKYTKNVLKQRIEKIKENKGEYEEHLKGYDIKDKDIIEWQREI